MPNRTYTNCNILKIVMRKEIKDSNISNLSAINSKNHILHINLTIDNKLSRFSSKNSKSEYMNQNYKRNVESSLTA